MNRFYSRFIVSALMLLGVFGIAHAQNPSLNYDFYRTEDVPGYFMIEIEAPESKFSQVVYDIYVKNYSDEYNDEMSDLISYLREFNAKVIERDEADKYQDDSFRLVYLGGNTVPGEIVFEIPEENILEKFEEFQYKWVGPVILKNVDLTVYSDSLHSIFPTSTQFLSREPVTFVGKIDSIDPDSRFLIEADSILFHTQTEVDLDTSAYIKDNSLEQKWKDMSKNAHIGLVMAQKEVEIIPETTPVKPLEIVTEPTPIAPVIDTQKAERSPWWNLSFLNEEKQWDLRWINAFPWILLGLGVLILLSFFVFRNRDWEEEIQETWLEEDEVVAPVKTVEAEKPLYFPHEDKNSPELSDDKWIQEEVSFWEQETIKPTAKEEINIWETPTEKVPEVKKETVVSTDPHLFKKIKGELTEGIEEHILMQEVTRERKKGISERS